MRHRTNTKTYSTWLKLIKKINPKTGRKHYSVIVDPYCYVGYRFTIFTELHTAWRQHFDPAGNRGTKTGLSWTFSNKEQAEQLIIVAILKWGSKHESTKIL